jgi:Zn-dependent metalloprotease
MENITVEQKELLASLQKRLEEGVDFRWDEARGIASSIRRQGGLLPSGTAEGEQTSSSEDQLNHFIQEYGPLLGPPSLSPGDLVNPRNGAETLSSPDLVQKQYVIHSEAHGRIEVYGAKLVAHFKNQKLIQVQSSLWRETQVPDRAVLPSSQARMIHEERLAHDPVYVKLSQRLAEDFKETLPFTAAPSLALYPWKGRFLFSWRGWGYGIVEDIGLPEAERKPITTYGLVFLDAGSGEQFLFLPAMRMQAVGSGSGVNGEPLQLNISPTRNPMTFILVDSSDANHPIITFDAAGNAAYSEGDEIAMAILQQTLPVSSDVDGDRDWDRAADGQVKRVDAQTPEAAAHYFARQQYDWYAALANRHGWDDNAFPFPPQAINLLVHCCPPDFYAALNPSKDPNTYSKDPNTYSKDPNTYGNDPLKGINAYQSSFLSGNQWIYWLAFLDGDGSLYDFPSGSRWLVAHEYQHAVTDFTFKDLDGNPGLPCVGWLGAVHEGLSDTFAGLSTDDWLPGREISCMQPRQVFRNLVYPRDPAAYDPSRLDHFADREVIPGSYARGTILAHCAYLMAQGGVHQRRSRRPLLIPCYGLGREMIGGTSFSKAARIWYRALTCYLHTLGAPTGFAENGEKVFGAIRDACLAAAEDLYGQHSREVQATMQAFYAVGLHPAGQVYGADLTFLRRGIDWNLSRPYAGMSCPDFAARDLFLLPFRPLQPGVENDLYCRVRNIGDQPAEGVQVRFWYAPLSPAPVAWLQAEDRSGSPLHLYVGDLAAGQPTFPDSAQRNPPAEAGVKWVLPAVSQGDPGQYYSLKAEVQAQGDVNPGNNLVVSNVVYLVPDANRQCQVPFLVGNPGNEPLPYDIQAKTFLPIGWSMSFETDYTGRVLDPGETVAQRLVIHAPVGAGGALILPLDGEVVGSLTGSMAGSFTGVLTEVSVNGHECRGRLSACLSGLDAINGVFTGSLDVQTGEISGRLMQDTPCIQRNEWTCLGVQAHLEPWRRVEISQRRGNELLGGISVVILDVGGGEESNASV